MASTSARVGRMLCTRSPCSLAAATTSSSVPEVSRPHAQRRRIGSIVIVVTSRTGSWPMLAGARVAFDRA
jgi:hypothetical protein